MDTSVNSKEPLFEATNASCLLFSVMSFSDNHSVVVFFLFLFFIVAEMDACWKKNSLGAAEALVAQLASLRTQLHAVCFHFHMKILHK